MASEEELQQYHTAMLKPTTNIWEPSSISTKESKFISYLDYLYDWAMSRQLPTSEFKWMTDDELHDWKHLSCILKVDLDYPEQLLELHNDYPLAEERVKLEM